MNVFCCLCKDRHVLLGIPPNLSWSIKAVACDHGSILTLCIDGENDVPLLGGKPVNLSEQPIEVKDISSTCIDVIGTVQHLDIAQIADGISYFEIIRYSEDSLFSETVSKPHMNKIDYTTFSNWSKILVYLEERFGAVAVSAWLDDAIVTEFTEDKLKIKASTSFKCDIIRRRCVDYIQDALKELFKSNATVEVWANTDYPDR